MGGGDKPFRHLFWGNEAHFPDEKGGGWTFATGNPQLRSRAVAWKHSLFLYNITFNSIFTHAPRILLFASIINLMRCDKKIANYTVYTLHRKNRQIWQIPCRQFSPLEMTSGRGNPDSNGAGAKYTFFSSLSPFKRSYCCGATFSCHAE